MSFQVHSSLLKTRMNDILGSESKYHVMYITLY